MRSEFMGDEQDKLMELFNEARARNTPEERDAYLTAACAGDAALRRQVEALLKADTRVGNFLNPPSDDPPDCEGPGTVIGHYKLLQRIGEGGFGVVYMAEQVEPMRRKVALKIIKPGMDTKEVIARFEAERQALALMDHPNIARVFDAGITGCPLTPSLSPTGGEGVRRTGEGEAGPTTLSSGRPYFVMELVKGIPITDYCDQHQLPPADRLQLFLNVCHAVQHAHQKGVIHRDLKPSNILVTEQDGEPLLKIIDFGVAKAIGQPLTDKTLFTRLEQMIGTPTYMSPEQAGLGNLDLDTRTDIYALGVLLYELLTGTTPVLRETLHQAAVDEVRRMIREAEPPKPSTRLSALGEKLTAVATRRQTEPSTLQKLVRGDLDWIVMRCLEKDRRRRYDTAEALAQDIGRHLRHEPVLANPPNTVYLARKFIRRHRRGVILAAAVSAALIVGLLASLIGFTRATQQRRLARQSLYFAHMRLAGQDWEAGQIGRMLDVLQQHVPRAGESDHRGWEWYYMLSLGQRAERTLYGHTGAVFSVSIHPSGLWFASGGEDHTVRIWSARTGQLVAELKRHCDHVRAVAWSPDGTQLASGGIDGKLIRWNSETHQVLSVSDCPGKVLALAWSPDGKKVAAGLTVVELSPPAVRRQQNPLVTIWDTASGKRLYELKGEPGMGGFYSLAWEENGRRLAAGQNLDGQIFVWDAGDRVLLNSIKAHDNLIGSLAWSSDGKRLASCSWDSRIRVWDAQTWAKVIELEPAHEGNVLSLAWSADGRTLLSGGTDGTVTAWDAGTGAQLNRLRGHQGRVLSVAWWEQLGLVLSGGADGCLKLWDPNQNQAMRTLAGQGSTVCWSPDGSQLVSDSFVQRGSEGAGFINIWDVAAWHIAYQFPYVAERSALLFAWSPDARRLAGFFSGGQVQVWDLTRREIVQTFGEPNPVDDVRSLQWSPDGQRLLAACYSGVARIWSLETNKPAFVFQRHQVSLSSAAWHPSGRRIASKDFDGRVLLWDAATGEVLTELRTTSAHSPNRDHHLVWHPRGELLAAGCGDGTIKVWKAATGDQIQNLKGHTANVRSLSWSPDGLRLVSASEDRTIRIWDAETGRELLRLPCRSGSYTSAAWSPNGRVIAVSHEPVWILDATLGYDSAAKLTATGQRP